MLQPKGTYGFWPASSDGDDILLEDGTRLAMLRQQSAYGDARPNRSLADYVAPENDYLGGFAVAIHGADELAAAYEAEHDDYHAIMVKALADRFAEAFAEYLHQQARRDWYETGTELSSEDLIAERFRGIRPAYGYPACPDHTEKRTLFGLLPVAEVGVDLTETCAMVPASAVSGIYLAHPQARYFSVGRIGRDQVEDYAPERESRSRRRNGGSDPTWHTTRRQRRLPPRSELSSSGDAREGVCRILMRTTLKRGVGRATGGNGNGYAALPPAGLTAISHYRQPRRRGGIPGLIAGSCSSSSQRSPRSPSA